MNACMLIPHFFSPPSHRRKIYEKESQAAEAFPALPRLWLPITPYEYVTVHMEAHVHMDICTWMYAHKKKIIHKQTLAFCFPAAGSPTLELRDGQLAGKGSRAPVWPWLHMLDTAGWGPQRGQAEDEGGRRQAGDPGPTQELPSCRGWDRAGPASLAYPNNKKNSTPCPFLKGLYSLGVPIHPAGKTAMPKPSWGSDMWWAWPTGYQPQAAKCR